MTDLGLSQIGYWDDYFCGCFHNYLITNALQIEFSNDRH